MPWQGIWFESQARANGDRDPEWLQAFGDAVAYPYPRNFVEAEEDRLRGSTDPSRLLRDGERRSVYYSLCHDGGADGIDQQGCRILRWLFERFNPDGSDSISGRFSEIPVVIHEPDPIKAAALGNALTLLRFLAGSDDQAIAKMMLCPWDPRRGSPRIAAQEYEKRVFAFLNESDLFYPDDIDLFDVLERRDLRAHRSLAPCCQVQIGFILPLLEWIDDCWPKTQDERADLTLKLRNSLGDEARFVTQQERERSK